MEELRGELGYKGERGYSAYEIAVKNGYEGTEQEWIEHFGLDLSGYVQTSDVVDDLTSEYTTRPLSAKQGKVLKSLIDTPISEVGNFEVANGGLEYTYTLKKDYDSDDVTRVAGIVAGTIEPTAEDIELYDFNGDGEIKSNDKLKLEKLIEMNCATGVTSPAKLKIIPNSLPQEANFGLYDCDGKLVSNDYKLKNEFAVVTGSVSCEKGAYKYIYENYPTGFTKNNCMVISVELDNAFSCYGGNVNTSYHEEWIFTPFFRDNDISIHVTNTSATYDMSNIPYKILLMKVA